MEKKCGSIKILGNPEGTLNSSNEVEVLWQVCMYISSRIVYFHG